MSKNRFFLFTLLSILSLSACGGVSDSAVKPAEIIRGTTNNETLNGYRSFELGEAILLFMPDKNMDSISWDYRLDSPISWLTDGFKKEEKTKFFRRHGLMRINVMGTPASVLKKTKEEMPWVVTYSTENQSALGVESILLSVGENGISSNLNRCMGSLYENCSFDAEKSMSAVGITYQKVCQEGSIFGYELKHPAKRTVLARQIDEGGSHWVYSDFELVFSKDAKDLCKYDDDDVTSVTDKVQSTSENPTTSDEQLKLALHYDIQKDQKKAVYWYTKAAEQGNVDAQLMLASYCESFLQPKDTKKALYWYRKAADNGDPDAQFTLGKKYLNGENIEKNTDQAIYWFTKSAQQGYQDAKEILLKIKGEKISREFSKKPQNKSKNGLMTEIIARCQNTMGQHGAAMVKACVDQDLEAFNTMLAMEYSKNKSFSRCKETVMEYGFAMIKSCIEQDSQAEEALKRY